MDNTSVNLRFLLWKQNQDRRTWPDLVAEWVACDILRAEELLRGDRLRKDEVARLAKSVGISGHDLAGNNLLSKAKNVDILRENLRCLVGGLERGEKRVFALAVGVHATTVSAWLSGKQRAERTNVGAVCRYFRLPAGTDLEKDLLFLSPLPAAEISRKRWLKEKIDGLDAAALQELFPALAKLLGLR